MRAGTRFKKLDNNRIEKTDELTGKTEIINTDEIADELRQFLHDIHSENYEQVIGTFDEKNNKISYLFFNYNKLVDHLFNDLDENLYFLESGCISQEDLKIILKETGEQITLNPDSPHEEILKYKSVIRQALFFDFKSKKEKADAIFFEITNKIDNGEKIDLAEMMKKMNEIDRKVTKPEKPQWMLDAIAEGQLEKDGKTLRVSADDMVHWLFTYGVEGVDTDFMMKNFRLRMKHSTAQQAVSRGKPEFVKKKKKK